MPVTKESNLIQSNNPLYCFSFLYQKQEGNNLISRCPICVIQEASSEQEALGMAIELNKRNDGFGMIDYNCIIVHRPNELETSTDPAEDAGSIQRP